MTKEQVNKMSEQYARAVFNNIIATHNLVNIQQVKGKDLEIKDKDKYTYILTYSFPCQDLSLAGKGKGMSDTSTRSGMLWEVERILTECKELNEMPQILLMENVPQVHSVDNIDDFKKWVLRLEELGYKNYWQDLIATDYGIPQTRTRCFMISILGDYSYSFPPRQQLKNKLKDLLEENVDEKYYLSDKMRQYVFSKNDKYQVNESNLQINREIACSKITREGCSRADSSDYISDQVGENFDYEDYKKINEAVDNLIKENKVKENDALYTNFTTRKIKENDFVQNNNISPTLTTSASEVAVAVNMKKQLCNELIKENKVKENDVIRHSYSSQRIEHWDDRGVEKNNISPTLDTRCDTLGVCVIGNYSPSKHNASRVVDQNYSAPTVTENHGTVTATQTKDLRIRKLTPKECFRLMGVRDEDFEKVRKNQSDSSLYHLAGDSIVVNVLMAIFKELL